MWKVILLSVLILIIILGISKKYSIENLTNAETKFEQDEDKYANVIKETDLLYYMRKPQSVNTTSYQDIPTIDYIGKKTKVNLRQILKTRYLQKLFQKYIIPQTNDNGYVKINFYKKNQKSWQNTYLNLSNDIFVDHKLIKSKYNIVNRILLKINNIIKNQFILYKYAITNIYMNKQNQRKWGIMIVLLQEYGLYGYTIYIRGFENPQTKDINLDVFEIVGYEYTQNLFLKKGNDQEIGKSIPTAAPYGVKPEKIETPLKDKDITRPTDEPYACFSIETGNLIKAFNKLSCESAYDAFGRQKEVGVWDKPCKKDDECFFYKSNKNYSNKFGKCNQGYCQVPKGVRRIGYKYYDPDSKPLCYNCDKNSWFPASILGTCCDKQKKEFKSSDYAFDNDLNTRMNYFRQKNFKVKKSDYIQE